MSYTPKRGKPYVWVTWLTKFLAGEEPCALKPWFKAHYEYDKLEEDPERKANLAKWTKEHDAMVAKFAAEQRAQWGRRVCVEDDNAFKLQGATAIVAGKPDILVGPMAMEPSDVIGYEVIDAKSGKKRGSDHWQIRVYLISLPLTVLDKSVKLVGRLLYKDGLTDPVTLTKEHRDEIRRAMEVLTAPKAPKPTPSRIMCDRCDIADCKFRFQAAKPAATGQTDLW